MGDNTNASPISKLAFSRFFRQRDCFGRTAAASTPMMEVSSQSGAVVDRIEAEGLFWQSGTFPKPAQEFNLDVRCSVIFGRRLPGGRMAVDCSIAVNCRIPCHLRHSLPTPLANADGQTDKGQPAFETGYGSGFF